MKPRRSPIPRASSFIVHRSSFRNSAFTLVELMISIALVLLLVIGINQVFSLTGQTVGAGQINSAQQRDMRAASKQMADDFAGALATDGPCFIIGSSIQPAFRTANDAKTDPDYATLIAGTPNPIQAQVNATAMTQDLNNNGVETDPGETLSAVIPNSRVHRIDQVAFFARGSFHRQTGDPGTFVSSTTAPEAFINYGHLNIANNSIVSGQPDYTYLPPGRFTPTFRNDNNTYATQWILGRSQILLQPTVISDTWAYRGTNQLSPLNRSNNALNSAQTATLNPTTPDPGAPMPSNSTAYTNGSSRIDLAETSIDRYSATLSAFFRSNPFTSNTFVVGSWYTSNGLLYRFNANPFVTKPQTSRSTALASPAFLSGCTQFIVEYAGDFVTQDAFGNVTDAKPDGIIDFVIPTAPGTYPLNGGKFLNEGIRQTRWYGFPRDTDGDGIIYGGSGHTNNQMPDVVPVRDVLASASYNTASSPSFEYFTFGPKSDYVTAGLTSSDTYTAAWALNQYTVTDTSATPVTTTCSGGPKLLRVLITLDDPNAHQPDGQSFQYVFTLK